MERRDHIVEKNYIITFTEVPDQRFAGRHILIGHVAGAKYYACYESRRTDAEEAIRLAFVRAFAEAG